MRNYQKSPTVDLDRVGVSVYFLALLQDFLLLQRFIPHSSSRGWWALTEVYQQPQSILTLPSSVSSPAVSPLSVSSEW